MGTDSSHSQGRTLTTEKLATSLLSPLLTLQLTTLSNLSMSAKRFLPSILGRSNPLVWRPATLSTQVLWSSLPTHCSSPTTITRTRGSLRAANPITTSTWHTPLFTTGPHLQVSLRTSLPTPHTHQPRWHSTRSCPPRATPPHHLCCHQHLAETWASIPLLSPHSLSPPSLRHRDSTTRPLHPSRCSASPVSCRTTRPTCTTPPRPTNHRTGQAPLGIMSLDLATLVTGCYHDVFRPGHLLCSHGCIVFSYCILTFCLYSATV